MKLIASSIKPRGKIYLSVYKILLVSYCKKNEQKLGNITEKLVEINY